MVCRSREPGVLAGAQVPSWFDELVDRYEAYALRVRGLAAQTIKEQRLYLGRFLGSQPVASETELFGFLTAGGIRRFVCEYADTHGRGSRRWMQVALRGFLRFCYQRGYLSCDLSSAVPAFRPRRLASLPKAIDDGVIAALLKSLDGGGEVAVRDFAIMQLLATYGIRGIQARQLCLDDIEWVNNRIQFRPVKGGNLILQHLTPEVGNSLVAYIRDVRPRGTSYAEVFLTSRPPVRPLSSSGSFASMIARRLRQIGAQLPAGVSRGAHSFRHAFAARLTGHVPFKHLADMLGHRDLSSTFLYSKVNFTALHETALPWPKEVTP